MAYHQKMRENDGTHQTYDVVLLSQHDLQEVQVIMSNHVPRENVLRQQQDMARQFYGDY
jgi:hypothetical protein